MDTQSGNLQSPPQEKATSQSADTIREITRTLVKDGVDEGKKQAQQIIEQAKIEAARITQKAQAEADQLLEATRQKLTSLKEHTETEIRIAARELFHDYHHELTNMLRQELVEGEIKSVMLDNKKVTSLIFSLLETMTTNFAASEGSIPSIEILVPEPQRKEFMEWYESAVKKRFGEGVNISFSGKIKNGFQIIPDNGSYKIDLTTDAFIELFAHYLKPRTRKLIFE